MAIHPEDQDVVQKERERRAHYGHIGWLSIGMGFILLPIGLLFVAVLWSAGTFDMIGPIFLTWAAVQFWYGARQLAKRYGKAAPED